MYVCMYVHMYIYMDLYTCMHMYMLIIHLSASHSKTICLSVVALDSIAQSC